MEYFGKTIYIVTAEDLIISKLIWIQDFQSAIQMEDINTLDWDYIYKWLADLKLKTFNLIEK